VYSKTEARQPSGAQFASHGEIWKGCFVAPQEFRRGGNDAALLGGSCRADKDREIRAVIAGRERRDGCNNSVVQ
jgi:hypothetical protein